MLVRLLELRVTASYDNRLHILASPNGIEEQLVKLNVLQSLLFEQSDVELVFNCGSSAEDLVNEVEYHLVVPLRSNCGSIIFRRFG